MSCHAGDVYLSHDCRQQLLSFLEAVSPLSRLETACQMDERSAACMPMLLELCQSRSGAQLACGLENTISTCLHAVMTTPAQLSEITEWNAWIASLGQLVTSQIVPDTLLLRLVETAVPATVSLLARWSHATSGTPKQSKGNDLCQVGAYTDHHCDCAPSHAHYRGEFCLNEKCMLKFCILNLTAKGGRV
jgi:hypothetical protein